MILNNQHLGMVVQWEDRFYGSVRGNTILGDKNNIGGPDNIGGLYPDFVQIARAYGLPAMRIEGSDFNDALIRALAEPAPLVVEVMLDRGHTFHPKLSSVRLPDGRIVSKPLEDLSPLLPRDEFLANMIVPVWPED